MTPEALARKAAKLRPADGKRNTDRWMPTVRVMRHKGYSYDAIWKFLKNEREDVHENVRSFVSAVSARYMREQRRNVK